MRRPEPSSPHPADADWEISEESEQGPGAPSMGASLPTPTLPADPRRAWRLRDAERFTEGDRRLGHDPGGWCVEHNRWLTWREQNRGACSWCVPVGRNREPDQQARDGYYWGK